MLESDERRKTVLVVDDDSNIRYLVASVLRKAGYQVVEASDGDEAITVANREPPDLILMDLAMPQRSGISAIYRIRKNLALRDVPIVAVTAYSSADMHRDALKAGCQSYLTKPFNVEELKSVVSRLLGDR